MLQPPAGTKEKETIAHHAHQAPSAPLPVARDADVLDILRGLDRALLDKVDEDAVLLHVRLHHLVHPRGHRRAEEQHLAPLLPLLPACLENLPGRIGHNSKQAGRQSGHQEEGETNSAVE